MPIRAITPSYKFQSISPSLSLSRSLLLRNRNGLLTCYFIVRIYYYFMFAILLFNKKIFSLKVKYFPVWIRNRLISAGFNRFSVTLKIMYSIVLKTIFTNIKTKLVLILSFFHPRNIRGKLSIIRCDK